jgi:hypothetical protein
LLLPNPTPRNQKQAEAEEKAKAKDKDKDKDNKEEEVTNLLPTTANTANISHPLSGSITAEE